MKSSASAIDGGGFANRRRCSEGVRERVWSGRTKHECVRERERDAGWTQPQWKSETIITAGVWASAGGCGSRGGDGCAHLCANARLRTTCGRQGMEGGRCRRGGAVVVVVVEEVVRGRRLTTTATTVIDLTRFLLQARGWRGQVGRVSEQQLCSPAVELTGGQGQKGSQGPRRDPAIGPGMVFCTRTAVGVHWLL